MMVVGPRVNVPDRDQLLTRGIGMAEATCTVEGCSRAHHAKGYCRAHHTRWLRHGDVGAAAIQRKIVLPTSASLEERFWAKVDKLGSVSDYAPHLGPCWIWLGSHHDEGYGRIKIPGRRSMAPAHVVAYEWATAATVPAGCHLDHLCRRPSCVRPSHLEPVTPKEHSARGLWGALRDTCSRGHPWPANRVKNGRKADGRQTWTCRACKVER